MKKEIEQNKGITLVALIITIVVMLILVAVSVNVVVKSNLIGTAEKTVNKYKTASEEESKGGVIEINGKKYNSIEDYIDLSSINIPGGTRVTDNTEYKVNDETAWIPAGFTVSGIDSERTIDGGLVIYDIPEGTTPDWSNPDSVKTKYNQFVWIPVEVKSTDTENSIASFYRSLWAENTATGGERTTGLSTSTSYIEPFPTDNGIADQITELTKSIYKYGGFYIGRYEAGSEAERTKSSSQTAKFVVQQDKYPYNYVKWNQGNEGAVYLCNNLYSSTNTNYGATSMPCTGAAWDSMLDFIKDSNHSVTDSTTWGNYQNSETYTINRGKYAVYNTSNDTLENFQDVVNEYPKEKGKSILLTTGATERNSSKNIYDVAGNVCEWTTESISSNCRVTRGRYLRPQWFWLSSEYPLPLHLSDLQRPQLPRLSSSTLCKTVSLQAI